MIHDVLSLLQLFYGHVPDAETHSWTVALASDVNKWPGAHSMFTKVRKRNLEAVAKSDKVRECQYCFEEVCLKSIYNETDSKAPFDSDSPYWIIKTAYELARQLGISDEAVTAVIAPHQNRIPLLGLRVPCVGVWTIQELIERVAEV